MLNRINANYEMEYIDNRRSNRDEIEINSI